MSYSEPHAGETYSRSSHLGKMRFIWLATLVPSSLAITLLQVLETTPELSTLYSYVNGSANATSFIANSNNFTFFAPSNDAISALIQSKGNATLNEDLLLASLQYGMVKGGYPSLSFTNNSQFASTNLASPKYANVTGGQIVELIIDDIGNPQVVSGNKVSAGVGDVSHNLAAVTIAQLILNRNLFALVALSMSSTISFPSRSRPFHKFQLQRCSTLCRSSTRRGI